MSDHTVNKSTGDSGSTPCVAGILAYVKATVHGRADTEPGQRDRIAYP